MLRRRILYDSPDAGETLGTHSAAKAYARFRSFLGTCTDAPPDKRWTRVAAEFDAGQRPTTMRLSTTFLLVHPGTDEPLPFQEAKHYAGVVPFPSRAAFSLAPKHRRRAPRINLTLYFPFEEPSVEFVDYFDTVCNALGHRLDPKRLRLRVPTADGSSETSRKLAFPAS